MHHATPPPLTRSSPLTLSFLFCLVTLGAILSACLRPLVGSETATSAAFSVVISIGVGLGLVSGMLLGGLYFRSGKAVVIGIGLGLGVGGVAGCLALVDRQHFGQLMSIAFVGSWILILTMSLTARHRSLPP